ncbi:protein KINESIN LIGHT CHAIN-RELATED 2-like isoform X2 [Silene latifolia]
MELANVKNGMGRREEALDNLRKSLEIKEFLSGEDSRDVGNANRDLAEACVANLNFRDGLPYCLKALKIHLGLLGENSVEVAHDRRLLGVIYTGMEEHEKALEENRLAQKVLKNSGCTSDLLGAEVDAANMHIALGKYEAATNTLKGVFQSMEKDNEDRSLILITMGKALVHQEKFVEAKRCFEIACSVLNKKEKSKQLEVSEAYTEISMQYETMNEFETAISLLKRALALLEKLPQEQHSEGSVSARIGWLLLLTGRAKQAIPYLESAAETLKESFGSTYFGVGHIYNNLGFAYLELERPESAAQMFAVAKDIMDVSFGPHHIDSIEACQNLSKAYAAMRSYPLAIEFQQKAVDALEGHGRSAADERREARRILEQLKVSACGASSKDNPTKALPLPHSSDANRSLQPPQPSSPKGHERSVEDELREVPGLLEVSPRDAVSKDYPTKAQPLPNSADASRSLQPPQPSRPKGHGCSVEDELREARRLLEKVSSRGALSEDYPTKAQPLPHSSDASRSLQPPQPSSPKQSG